MTLDVFGSGLKISKFCPNCGQNRVKIDEKEWYEDGGEFSKDKVHFISLVIACQHCGYGWNCVGTKKVK